MTCLYLKFLYSLWQPGKRKLQGKLRIAAGQWITEVSSSWPPTFTYITEVYFISWIILLQKTLTTFYFYEDGLVL